MEDVTIITLEDGGPRNDDAPRRRRRSDGTDPLVTRQEHARRDALDDARETESRYSKSYFFVVAFLMAVAIVVFFAIRGSADPEAIVRPTLRTSFGGWDDYAKRRTECIPYGDGWNGRTGTLAWIERTLKEQAEKSGLSCTPFFDSKESLPCACAIRGERELLFDPKLVGRTKDTFKATEMLTILGGINVTSDVPHEIDVEVVNWRNGRREVRTWKGASVVLVVRALDFLGV